MPAAHAQRSAPKAESAKKSQANRAHAAEKSPSHSQTSQGLISRQANPLSSPASFNPSSLNLIHLQRTVGNRAVGRFLQAKLAISQPDDPYEREADRVADTVMRMPAPAPPDEEETSVQTKPLATTISPLVQREAQQHLEEEEDKVVATKPLVQRVPMAVPEDDEEQKVF